MRICIIHQYYKTPKTGGAIRSYYIAKYLQDLGHEVTVITARNNKAYSVDKSDGYDVHYLPVYYENHLSFLSRIHAFMLFVWKAYRLLKKMPDKPDLNYVITTPLTTGLLATRAKSKLGIPYIFEVGDLWPDAPIELGVINNSLLKKLSYKWEKTFYLKAQSIIALSIDIKNRILEKCPAVKIKVITNFADSSLFEASKKNPELEEKYKVKNYFVISYLGTVGIANHLEYLLEVARQTQSEKIKFIVAGSGARFDFIKNQAQVFELDNIQFYPHRNKYELDELVNITDAAFISFKNAPILATGSPNKFFDGLASGKLIIINFKGWIKQLIEEKECGFYHDPYDAQSFLDALNPYLNSQFKLLSAQSNAQELAKKFSPEQQLANLGMVLNEFSESKT